MQAPGGTARGCCGKGCFGCCGTAVAKASKSSDPNVIAHAVGTVVRFIADVLYALMTAALTAAVAIGAWLFCVEAHFHVVPSVMAVAAFSVLVFASRTHPKPGHHHQTKREAERLLNSQAAVNSLDEQVMHDIASDLSPDEEAAIHHWAAFRRDVASCICSCQCEAPQSAFHLPGQHHDSCITDCVESARFNVARPLFNCLDHTLLTPGIVQLLMVLTALLSVLEVFYGRQKTELARSVALACAALQVCDVLSTMQWPCMERRAPAFKVLLHPMHTPTCVEHIKASLSACAATVGHALDELVLLTVVGCFPAPRAPERTGASLLAAWSAQMSVVFTKVHRQPNHCCIPGWVTAPWKYLRSTLVVLGETIRHSPLKCIAAGASFVLAIDELNQLANDLTMRAAHLAGIAPSPPPPTVGSFFGFEGNGSDRVPGFLAPLFPLFGAIATALATTDGIRSVVRPDEFSLAKKLEHELSKAWEQKMGRLGNVYRTHVAKLLKLPPVEDIMNAAATGVQSAMRGKIARKTAKAVSSAKTSVMESAKKASEVTKAQMDRAAIKVQAAARGHKVRETKRGFFA